MPIKRAAAKAARQTAKHRARNLKVKTDVRRAVKAVRRAASARTKDQATAALTTAIKTIDRAYQKGVLKRNTAARLKSRLHAAVRRIG